MARLPLRRFDLSFRTAYAQARELARAQKQVPLVSAGSIQVEERKGSRFMYRYRYAEGKRISEYLGPEGAPETIAKADAARAEISDSGTLARYCRDLRKVGFYSADNSTLVTVATLFNAGIFNKGGLLVGTHAYGAILNELGINGDPFAMTEDVDIARAAPIEVAALPKGGFLDLLKSSGLPFVEVPKLRHKEPSTSFKVRGRNLIVDLLVPAKGESYGPVAVPELKAHATGLPHFAYLLKDPMPSMLIGRDRLVPIVVPHPGRFCVHKLAVYSLRSGKDNPKREKDVNQAAMMAAALASDRDFMLAEAIEATTRPLRTLAKAGAQRAIALLERDLPEAAGQLAALA